ncbi:hypothetical protein [Anaeromyxobacter oryzae]|uniref:Uncharacterized protein n=1 Tax=Anaeromyxobacter oryzae TaxID=2918170 RepID=A0ABM7X1Q2_9BACT|nr:hypothetical protein [Anaeromyxobacter oryzae]BDG05722.1 hypothetical protein AMOR_47180 [Anaeromyxobacter oryzae]
MKLEYLDQATPNRKPTLLLYGGGADVVRALAEALSSLTEQGVDLSTFPGVEAVDQCRVLVQRSKRETGIRRTGRNAFTWRLTKDSLDYVLGLLEPFMEPSTENGFQWLEEYGEIDFIVSRGRYC